MSRKARGFTLVELLVVVLIIGVLAAIAIPQYTKTVETSKADDAISTLQIVSAANRQFALDYPQYACTGSNCSSTPMSSCSSGACPCNGTTCAPYDTCNLIKCNYLSVTNFAAKGYDFYAADAASSAADPCNLGGSGNFTACAKRRSGSSPGTNKSPYTNWGYTIDIKGVVLPCVGGSGCSSPTDGPPTPPS